MANSKQSAFERLRLGATLNRKERREVQQRLNATDPGLEIVNRDAAGIDVGNESHYVAVPRGRDRQAVREFGSWTAAFDTNGTVVDPLRYSHGSDAVYRGVLDRCS
jgi:hypothetical protein